MSADFAVLLAQMQAGFIEELPERCNRLEDRVLALEQAEAGAFDELYRQVHSLKGAGGMFGIHIITSICHQFESFVTEAHERFDHKASNGALAYVDLLRKTVVPEGRSTLGLAEIEQQLERLRTSSLSGRISMMLVEPSAATRKVYQEVFTSLSVHTVMLGSGLAGLERLLHEPFDMLVVSRELPDLNATALVAALRESGGRNRDIPVVIVSSNPAPVPDYLGIHAMYPRDTKLVANLAGEVESLLNGADPAHTVEHRGHHAHDAPTTG